MFVLSAVAAIVAHANYPVFNSSQTAAAAAASAAAAAAYLEPQT